MSQNPPSRRQFLQATGLGLLAFQVHGAEVLLTAKQARDQKVPFRVLRPDEVVAVEALAEGLVPGARAAGIAHYLDHQLAAEPAASLLMLRYLDVPPPYVEFYRPAIAAASAYSRNKFGEELAAVPPQQLAEMIAAIAQRNPADWRGPPSPFFYFVLRSDAVDVVYGTPEGFEKLGIPYMAHIMPTERW